MRLPKLGRNSYQIAPINRRQAVAGKLDPIFGLNDACGGLSIDAEAERGTPDEVFDKLEFIAIVGKDPGAGALEPLTGKRFLVGRKIEFGLHRTVWPYDPSDVGHAMMAEPEVHAGSLNRGRLDQRAGAHFDPAADPKRVDAFVARRCVGTG